MSRKVLGTLHPTLTASEAVPLWQRIENLFQTHGASLPPTKLRDELVCLLDQALDTDITAARAVVDEQAEDGGLWCEPGNIVEDMLQKALRRLHEAVEGKTSEQCARAVLD